MLTNVITHWKTSVSGVLIATVSVSGVLMAHGVTGGKAGTSTYVEIAAAVATALLGLLARDPSPKV